MIDPRMRFLLSLRDHPERLAELRSSGQLGLTPEDLADPRVRFLVKAPGAAEEELAQAGLRVDSGIDWQHPAFLDFP